MTLLKYRGLNYEYNPTPVKVGSTWATGKYRGLNVEFHHTKDAPEAKTTQELVYRGVPYRKGKAVIETTKESKPSIAQEIRTLMVNHHHQVRQREQSMLKRWASNIGLKLDVSQYKNHIQGKTNSSFWETYDRSHTAMS